jgi:hypothetical protein
MDFREWAKNFKAGDWSNYRGQGTSGMPPGAGVDDLANMGAKDVAKQTFRTAVNANKTLPAGSWMAKEVPGAAGRVLDRAAAKVGLMAPEVASAGEAAAKVGFGARAMGAAGALLNPLNPLHATTSVLTAGAQGLNTSTDEYRQRMGLDSQDQADSVVGDTLVRVAGFLQDVGNNATYGLADKLGKGIANLYQDNPADTPLQLDPATAARGKALAAQAPRPAPVAPAVDKAKQQADAMARGKAADPDGSYAAAEKARLSNYPEVFDPNNLEKTAMDPNASATDRTKAVAHQYGVDPKQVTFKNMGPGGGSYFKVGKNTFTDGSNPNASRISNMNEPWTPEKAASLENAGRIERYNNYLRAGYDPATAEKLLNGGRVQDSTPSFRDMAAQMMAKAGGMKYGGNLRDDAIAMLGLAQKQDAENAQSAAQMQKNQTELQVARMNARKTDFRDALAAQQFGLDKQRFGYQQQKDEAEFNRGVAKDQAGMSQAQREASAKAHGERMAAAFNDPKTGKIDQTAAAEFNRRAAPAAASMFKKNIDQLNDNEFTQLIALQKLHDLTKNNAGVLPGYGSYKDSPDLTHYQPVTNKQGQYQMDGDFLVLRNGAKVNAKDLYTQFGNQWWNYFQTKASPRTFGVDPTKLPQ